MATRNYGLNRGETQKDVTEGVGNANVGKDIELSLDLTKNFTRAEVVLALKYFEAWVLSHAQWPPA